MRVGNFSGTDLAVVGAGAALNFVGFDMTSFLGVMAYFAFWPRQR